MEGFSDEALYGVAWYGKYTRCRMIQLNTSSPYKNAAGRLTVLLKNLDG
ncbi:ClbS/DfsB family four-helix bundle protein [Snodgrassella alvi]